MASLPFAGLDDEFALVAETAAETGLPGGGLPLVRRGWVNLPAGGRVSGVLWGGGPPELVFLHDSGESARVWDAVALAAGRPSVALDLPGHGRSSWRRDGRYEPGEMATAVATAIHSLAARAGLVAGTGLGGLTALALRRRIPALLSRLALVNTLPGSPPGRMQPRTEAERFASRETAFAVLAARRPERSRSSLRREILHELIQDPDGWWVWRHHPGNLPARAGAQAGEDETLWTELTQLTTATALVRSDWAGRLTAADLARLRQRAPHVEVLTVPGAGEDIVATQPTALASALNQLVAREVQQR